jgi:hypothetical protein
MFFPHAAWTGNPDPVVGTVKLKGIAKSLSKKLILAIGRAVAKLAVLFLENVDRLA